MKPTILMIPSWYPTKENPFNGCFFREQALAMQKYFNFVVCTIHIQRSSILKALLKGTLFKKKLAVSYIQDDNGLKEYSLEIISLETLLHKIFYKFFCTRNISRQGVGIKEDVKFLKKLNNAVKKIKEKKLLPDFNCVYTLTAQDMCIYGKIVSSVFNVPHVTAEHAPFPWPGRVISDETVNAIESADKFLAISNDKIRQIFLQNVKVDPIWVGNLCDETKFSLSTKKNDVPVFLIVAANSFYKNYPLFIKAMEELKRIANKPFKVKIAGYNSNKGYSQNANELENQVHNSIINENTTLIEAVNREDMPALYNSCDVFVMTSIQEGLPVSALEASMSGLPVISTRCGGVEDYIDDSMGRIFAITDYKGIANACNDYLNGIITFNAKEIREKAINLFGNEAFVERMQNVFMSVL